MSGGADQSLPEGWRIELHTQVSAPITLAGLPRRWAILIGTVVLVVSLGLKAPWLGIPLGLSLWVVCFAVTKDDPQLFEAAKRHLHHPSHLEG